MKRVLLFALLVILMALPLWATSPDNEKVIIESSGAWLGVYTQSVDEDLKDAFKLETDRGVIINQVVPNSPADKAGLKQGDIILSLDGDSVITPEQLAELVGKHNPNDAVKIKVIRKNKQETITATLGSREDESAPKFNGGRIALPRVFSKSYGFKQNVMADRYTCPTGRRVGVTLQSLNSQLGDYFGVKDGQGALITEVIEDSPAKKAGLKAGDVITNIDTDRIEDPGDVQDLIARAKKGDKLTLTLLREKKEIVLAVEVAESPDKSAAVFKSKLPKFDKYFSFDPWAKGSIPGEIDDSDSGMEEIQESIKQLQKQMEELQRQFNEWQRPPQKK
ncbi:MAG: PDZ domain-containing protein [candidate division Zixibacteria bacterium]|nr:PDZ domain-containing protein [candidate division Zixibacteria bacterium]